MLLKRMLEQLSGRYSPVLNSIRVPLALMLSERRNKRHSKIDYLIGIVSNSLFLIRSFLLNKIRANEMGPLKQDYVFVIDHNREPLIKVFLDLVRTIPSDDICILTVNRSIYERLSKDNVCNILYVEKLTDINLKDIKLSLEMLNGLAKIDPCMPIFDKFSIFVNLLKIICFERVYERILSNNVCSVVTLCDANLNEQVITRVGNKYDIGTYTLQHGMINMLWFPIVSKTFFVWNQHTKDICGQNYGVDPSQMVISGNPFIEAQNIRKRSNDLFTITYIVTNWGETENRILFKLFLKVSKFENIRLIVKIRPNPPAKMLSLYYSWMSKKERERIKVVSNKDIQDVLAETDLIVTFHSGVPVDAMAYNIPTILLDIFEEIDLKSLMSHYDDCIVVNTQEDYLNIANKMINDRDCYNGFVENVINCKEKYFPNMEKGDVLRLLNEKIVSDERKDSALTV